MFGCILAVAVQSPGEVFLEPVAMAVGSNHLRMVLEGGKHIRDVGGGWLGRTKNKAQAEERGQALLHPIHSFPGNPCLHYVRV